MLAVSAEPCQLCGHDHFTRLTGLSRRPLSLSRSDSFHKCLAQSMYCSVENGSLFYLLHKTSRNGEGNPSRGYEKQDEFIGARGNILQASSNGERRCSQDSPEGGQRLW